MMASTMLSKALCSMMWIAALRTGMCTVRHHSAVDGGSQSSSSSSLGSSSLSLPRRKERFGTSLKARALFPRIRAWIKVAAASASCC
jgi:hypothetical protein